MAHARNVEVFLTTLEKRLAGNDAILSSILAVTFAHPHGKGFVFECCAGVVGESLVIPGLAGQVRGPRGPAAGEAPRVARFIGERITRLL